ncbi:MAG: DUF1275 domain-containing protein [Polaribacter sp.]|nr:DUF1275 domain-containing protein [Polaribacter sp.]
MFRHQGKSRTLQHNLRIATILSFVAGMVNVTGFLSFKQLTTNVTGHFALFIYDVTNLDFWKGTIYFLYIISFFFGSFFSSFLIEKYQENKKVNIFLIPTLIESFILFSIGISVLYIEISSYDLIACLLLFAMGVQNSFVTKISNAVVRTTHLTGLFTDLGIDISLLFFPKHSLQKEKLIANIKLRLYIITSFFAGGLIGGFLYSEIKFGLSTLIFSAIILLLSLFYDDFRYKIIKTKRKHLRKSI